MHSLPKQLIWVDLEMTGLNPEHDRIIEMAVVVTDQDLNALDEGLSLVIHQNDILLDKMDEWNKKHHGDSGLIKRVKASVLSEPDAEQEVLHYIKQYVPAGHSPICGNTIAQDRRFMFAYMPRLESYFHYRYLDVTSIKYLFSLWCPDLAPFIKKNNHRAMDDILESIEELKYYRDALSAVRRGK